MRRALVLLALAACHGPKDDTSDDTGDSDDTVVDTEPPGDTDADTDADTDVACADGDTDGACDDLDGCPDDFDPDQADVDGDGLDDVCDPAPGTADVGAVPDGVATVLPTPGDGCVVLVLPGGTLSWYLCGADAGVTFTAIDHVPPADGTWGTWTLYRSASDTGALGGASYATWDVPITDAPIVRALRGGTVRVRVPGPNGPVVLDPCGDGVPVPCASGGFYDTQQDGILDGWGASAPTVLAGEYALVGEAPPDPAPVLDESDDAPPLGAIPTDPGLITATWDEQIGADEAWWIGAGGPLVAVIGDGIVGTHPDLPLVDHGVGVVELGIDTVAGDADPVSATASIGTNMAGLVAARADGFGIAGVAHGSHVLAIRGIGGTVTQLADAIDAAVDAGARIVVIGGGTDTDLTVLRDAVDAAWAAGVLVVNNAGGYGAIADIAKPRYPAAYDHVLAVTSVDAAGMLAAGARAGAWVDLAAPGVDVWTTDVGGGHASVDGSHLAGALVAGAAAVVWNQHPTWGPDEVAAHLIASGSAIPGLGATGTFPALDLDAAVGGGDFVTAGSWWTSATAGVGVPTGFTAGDLDVLGASDAGVLWCSTGDASVDRGICSLPLAIPASAGWRVEVDLAICSEEAPTWVGVGFDDRVSLTAGGSTGRPATLLSRAASELQAAVLVTTTDGRTLACESFRTYDALPEVTGATTRLRLTVADVGDPSGETIVLVDRLRLVPPG